MNASGNQVCSVWKGGGDNGVLILKGKGEVYSRDSNEARIGTKVSGEIQARYAKYIQSQLGGRILCLGNLRCCHCVHKENWIEHLRCCRTSSSLGHPESQPQSTKATSSFDT